jgi:hypothetical protein
MISWTETAPYTALTSASSHSAGATYASASYGSTGQALKITSADSDGLTYITITASGSSFVDKTTFRRTTSTSSSSYVMTDAANGARTESNTFESGLTEYYDGGSDIVSTLEPGSSSRQGSSATRPSQTTTATTVFAAGSITATTAVSGTVATTTLRSGSTAPTIRFTQSASTFTTAIATQVSKAATQTTSLSSTYTNYGNGPFGGVGRRTNIMPEPHEVIWVMTTTTSAAAELTAIATSYTSSFSLSPITYITARPAAITTAFYEVSEETVELTRATTARSGITQTRAFPQNNRFPMQTYSDIRNTETTVSTDVGSVVRARVFGSSTTHPGIGVTTMQGRFGGLTYHQEYTTTTTRSKFTDGLSLEEGRNSYSTQYNDGPTSVTEISLGSATLQGSVETWGLAAIDNSSPVSAIETAFTDGYAILTNVTQPATLLGLSPAVSVFMPIVTNRAWPRIIAPQLGTNSLGISQGSSTWSYNQIGVTQSSVGTAPDATIVTTSASWTQEGTAGTAQFDDPPGKPGAFVEALGLLRSPVTLFSGERVGAQRIGGVPATGASNISAVMPPGKYFTATGSSSTFVTFNSPTTLAGTLQTAFIPQPLFIALERDTTQGVFNPAGTLSASRNLLPYSSTFFPL